MTSTPPMARLKNVSIIHDWKSSTSSEVRGEQRWKVLLIQLRSEREGTEYIKRHLQQCVVPFSATLSMAAHDLAMLSLQFVLAEEKSLVMVR